VQKANRKVAVKSFSDFVCAGVSDVDILKARKKAAERKQVRKTTEPAQPTEASQIPEEPRSSPEAGPVQAAAPQIATTEAVAVDEPPTETVPDDAPEETAAQEIELLSFRLGEEAYTVLVKDVQEVLKVRDLTLVPNAPSYVLGVTSLRGTMLPVIDLCKRLGLPVGARDEKARIIVVSLEDENVGLIVDRVTGVLRILPEALKPTPENIAQGAEFLRGIVRKDDILYIVLDLEKTVEA
jgi:purine-binding chemotaxis protein CheW